MTLYKDYVDIPDCTPFRRIQEKNSFHWGQRKCLIGEIRFLLEAMQRFPTIKNVVYIGAADGLHIILLAELFPMLQFDCWDPSPFHPNLADAIGKGLSNVKLTSMMFDIRTAELITKDSDHFLISDVRHDEHDLEWQQEILVKMRSMAASLKFSLPFDDGKTTHIRGQIIVQPWCKALSTETRLLYFADDNPEFSSVSTSNREYEQRMFYHNTVTRLQEFYTHDDLDGQECLAVKDSYDMALEVAVWKQFIGDLANKKDDLSVADLVDKKDDLSVADLVDKKDDLSVTDLVNKTSRYLHRKFPQHRYELVFV